MDAGATRVCGQWFIFDHPGSGEASCDAQAGPGLGRCSAAEVRFSGVLTNVAKSYNR